MDGTRPDGDPPVKQHRTYTVAEVADTLRVGAYRVQQACREGKIPGAHKPLGTWLIDADTFDDWIEQSRQGAAS